MDKYLQIETFNKFAQVSRETISSFKKYEEILISSNKNLNLIGKSTEKSIWIRHFLDSAQVIDMIEKKNNILVDLGSGAGFPGLVLSIIAKDRKIPIKFKIIEKSIKKTKFLKSIAEKLNLNVEVISNNIFDDPKELIGDVFIARAFKPLNAILQLIHDKTKKWQKILIFLGKNGKDQIDQASKVWDMEYKQCMSITSNDSKIIEIIKLKKIN
jgi:16S rRNA (guanine527-N7)-methyltransferase